MTTIYLIRHAEAEGNLYRIAQGQHDSNLTDWGWRQVSALERRFEGVRIDAVYSSDLYRARATAGAICRPQGLPLHCRPGLREICVGDWEQRTWGEIARKYPQEMADFGQRMDRWRIPGAETPAEVQKRVLDEILSIAAENPNRVIAVFCHGYAIRLVLAKLQGVSLRDTGAKAPTGDNTSVSLLEFDGGTLRVVWQNDNRHLRPPAFPADGAKPRKRANALEPGLWFRPLSREGLTEEETAEELLTKEQLRKLLQDSGARAQPELRTLIGFLAEEPVALLQTAPAPDGMHRIAGADAGAHNLQTAPAPDGTLPRNAAVIHWLWVREDCRRRSYGIQVLGQALTRAREEGAEFLLAYPEEPEGTAFFRSCGFVPRAAAPGLVKDIGFRPETPRTAGESGEAGEERAL